MKLYIKNINLADEGATPTY